MNDNERGAENASRELNNNDEYDCFEDEGDYSDEEFE